MQTNTVEVILPYKSNVVLKNFDEKMKILNLLISVIEESIEAIQCFTKNEFEKFDAQVGETLCQIRAYKLVMLGIQNYDAIKMLDNDMRKLKEILLTMQCVKQTLIKNRKARYVRLLDDKESIREFIYRHHLSFVLNRDTLFLILSYFLTKYNGRDEDNIPQYINYKGIVNTLMLSKTVARRIAHHYQNMLACMSTNFILKISERLDAFRDSLKVLNDLCVIADGKKQVLPCFLVTNILIDDIIRTKTTLLLHINFKQANNTIIGSRTLIFKGQEFIGVMNNANITNRYNGPCFKLSGVSYVKNDINELNQHTSRIIQLGLKTIFLCNMASHPQYAGEKLSRFKESLYVDDAKMQNNKNNFISNLLQKYYWYKKQSEILGCSFSNRTLFFIKHIYCVNIDFAERDERNTFVANKEFVVN